MMPSIRIERAPSLADQIHERLTQAIVALEIPPGERIVIEQLAAQLEVSRTPLREALPRLVADGLLEQVSNGGLRVTPITPQYIREVYQTRAGPEAIATLLATPAIPPSAIEDMGGRFRVIKQRSDPNEFRGFYDAEVRFHELVVIHCGNRHLARTLQGLHYHVDRIRTFSRKRPGSQLLASHHEHLEVFEAILAGDARRAKELMELHILDAGERLAALAESLHDA